MDLQDYLGAAQSVAITVAFLFLTWQTPAMLTKWLTARKEMAEHDADEAQKVRTFAAEERRADRELRTSAIAAFDTTLRSIMDEHRTTAKELTAAIAELKAACERMCRYDGER